MRGLVFSLSMVLTGTLLLTTFLVLSQNNLLERGDMTKMVISNRLQDEFEYVSRGLELIMKSHNLNVTLDGNKVSVVEELPFPKLSNFTENINNWKTFTENYTDFKLVLKTSDLTNNLPLKINDQVEYQHTNGLSGNKITIENASIILNYSINIDIKANGNITADWDEKHSGSQAFSIFIKTNNDTFSDAENLDFKKANELDIKIGNKDIEIQVGKGSDEGFFKIDNQDRLPMILTINMTINSTEPISVGLPDSTINIESDQYNISRSDKSSLGL